MIVTILLYFIPFYAKLIKEIMQIIKNHELRKIYFYLLFYDKIYDNMIIYVYFYK